MDFSPPVDRESAYRRRMTQVFMRSIIEIVRPVQPQYDPVTGYALASSDTAFTGYTGKAHIGAATSAGTIMTGEAMTELSTVPVSLPWNATPMPREEDQVIVVQDEDGSLDNEVMRIIDVSRGGNGYDAIRLTCTFVTANPFSSGA